MEGWLPGNTLTLRRTSPQTPLLDFTPTVSCLRDIVTKNCFRAQNVGINLFSNLLRTVSEDFEQRYGSLDLSRIFWGGLELFFEYWVW